MKTRSFKPLWVIVIVVAALLLLAVIVGILNALIGGGKWSFGWSVYRYDETGFSVGSGTIYDADINMLDLDWVKGNAEVIVSEDDAYVSVSEITADELDESAQLRWKVENGKLTIKFRKPGRYYTGGVQKKHLIVRIPRKIAEQMRNLSLNSVSADIAVDGIAAETLTISGVSGSITLSQCVVPSLEIYTVGGNVSAHGCFSASVLMNSTGGNLKLDSALCPAELNVNTVGGNVILNLPADSSFALEYNRVGGTLVSDFPLEDRDGIRCVGDGICRFEVSTVGGDLVLTKAQG